MKGTLLLTLVSLAVLSTVSCTKTYKLYGTDVRGYDSPLRIVEINASEATFHERSGQNAIQLEDGNLRMSLGIDGDYIDSDLAGLEGMYIDDDRTLGNKTIHDQAYARTIYPRVKEIKKAWVVEHNAYRPATFYYMYISGVPSIVADRDCFGISAGSDLGNHFYIDGSGLINADGVFHLNMPQKNSPLTFHEFFCDNALLTKYLIISAEGLNKYIPSGEEMNLTITLPYKGENFWTYALALEREHGDESISYTEGRLELVVTVRH